MCITTLQGQGAPLDAPFAQLVLSAQRARQRLAPAQRADWPMGAWPLGAPGSSGVHWQAAARLTQVPRPAQRQHST